MAKKAKKKTTTRPKAKKKTPRRMVTMDAWPGHVWVHSVDGRTLRLIEKSDAEGLAPCTGEFPFNQWVKSVKIDQETLPV